MARWSQAEQSYMKLALDLAVKGQGFVEPNPMVGCVLVKGGRIVGQGYHRKFGDPHAEPEALRRAGDKARGATAYVTLEPCNHTGKTPPCTEALIQAKVRRVVAAMEDPNPIVAGKGFHRLRAAGIRVNMGLLHDEAMMLNAPFVKFHRRHRPWVILKWAQSIDGKIATRTGDSRWISSLESRKAGHALRARVDAIVVGVNTVLADDPQLTARLVAPKRVATRIVLDSGLTTPLTSKIVRTARRVPAIIVASRPASASDRRRHRGRAPTGRLARRAEALERAGCEVLWLPSSRSGIHLDSLLAELHARGMTNLLVEGGGRVLGAFVDRHLADEAWVFVAPRLIGGEDAPGPLRHRGPAFINDLSVLTQVRLSQLGPDLCYNISFAKP
jgi:diaminohydroxyphosphoribosylaminopyrimidine deaminase/5-amino-6-(5-phosphoribosylamino)uracil reductase